MTIDKNDLLNSILASIERIDYVKSADIPNIDLYMDQVTTFIESQLAPSNHRKDGKIYHPKFTNKDFPAMESYLMQEPIPTPLWPLQMRLEPFLLPL